MSSMNIYSLPGMVAMTVNWKFVTLLIVAHLALAFRVSFYARAMGRRQWLWFLISVFASILPMMALAMWYRFGWLITGAPRPGQDASPPQEGPDA